MKHLLVVTLAVVLSLTATQKAEAVIPSGVNSVKILPVYRAYYKSCWYYLTRTADFVWTCLSIAGPASVAPNPLVKNGILRLPIGAKMYDSDGNDVTLTFTDF